MARTSYPLDAVERLRTQARDGAALELAAAEARVAEAEAGLQELQAALERTRQARGKFAGERPAHTDGAGMQREAVFATRLQGEVERAAGAVTEAAAALKTCRTGLAAARDALARAEAERAVLARDHAKHDDDERRRQARAEELEQEEDHSGRRPGR